MKISLSIAYVYLILLLSSPILINSMDNVPKIFDNIPSAIVNYFNNLPKIPLNSINDTEKEKATTIIDYLLQFNCYPNDIDGKGTLCNTITNLIIQKKPIIRCIPAFPVGTQNTEKIVYDKHTIFSFGDLLALLTRYHIGKEISKLYAPGSHLIIYFEEFIHNMNSCCTKNIGIPLFNDNHINSYQNSLKKAVTHLYPLVQLNTLNTKDLYQNKYANLEVEFNPLNLPYYSLFVKNELNSPLIIQHIEQNLFEEKRAELEKIKRYQGIIGNNFLTIMKNKNLYKKIKMELPSKATLKKFNASLTEEALKGSLRMTQLMQHEIPGYNTQIRESVRPDLKTINQKIGIAMIYGCEGTPWHNMLCIENNRISLQYYKDIKKNDHEIKYYEFDGLRLSFCQSNCS